MISEHATGVELFLDLDVIEPATAARTRRLLENALAAFRPNPSEAVRARMRELIDAA